MTKRVLSLAVLSMSVAFFASEASACWDNSDGLILKLKRLDLNTDQLKDVFSFQKEHRAVVARAHSERLGCRYHENHDAVFEKKAIGVLNNVQFKKYTGRVRTKVEILEHENWRLQKEIAKLRALIEKLQKQLEKNAATGAAKTAPSK